MSLSVTFNGSSWTIPQVGEKNWGVNLTNFLQAVGQNALAKSGGTFTLTADANFGNTFGLIAAYFKSASSNIAGAGILRLANADAVGWRNIGNSADILLQPHADGILQYNGVDLVTLSATQTLTSKTLTTPLISGATSTSANPAATGVVRLANADGIGFRNSGNSADQLLQPDADGILQYNAVDLVNLSASQTLTNKTLTSPTINTSPSVAPCILYFGQWASTTVAGTYYMLPGMDPNAVQGTLVEIAMPVAGKISNMRYIAQTAQSGGSLTVNLMKNGSTSGITVNALSIGTGGVQDSTHSVSVAVGDRIGIQYVVGATVSTAATQLMVTFMFTQA